jgi:hypothetical protein
MKGKLLLAGLMSMCSLLLRPIYTEDVYEATSVSMVDKRNRGNFVFHMLPIKVLDLGAA